jgi:hypothetical protein
MEMWAKQRSYVSRAANSSTQASLFKMWGGPEKGRFWSRRVSYSLAAESVESAPLALERVDDVHGGDGLSLGVLRVGDGIADDVL